MVNHQRAINKTLRKNFPLLRSFQNAKKLPTTIQPPVLFLCVKFFAQNYFF